MAILVILVLSDSSEGSVRTPAGRVILFKIPTILPTVPTSHDHTPALPDITPASPDYSPASPDYSLAFDTESDPSKDPSSCHTPPLPAISPFLSLADDTIESDTPNTPPSPTHAPGQPIPYGRPYRYHPNGPASSDFHLNASFDSTSRHSMLDHSSPNSVSTSTGPSRKTHVPALSPISRAISPVHADLIPSSKPVRDSGYLADVEVDPRETGLRDDVMIRSSDEPHLEQYINLEIQAEIDDYFSYADAFIVERVTLPMMLEDTLEPASEERVIEGVKREQGRRIVGVESRVTALTKRIAELEKDNRSLRGIMSVESQRVDRLHHNMKMTNTRSRAFMTHEEVDELVSRRVGKEMEAREAARNLETLNENGDEQEGENGG
nr:hypothetical protein [Tanacetum cinerariifolium]